MESNQSNQRPPISRSKTAAANLSPPKEKNESKLTSKISASKLHLPSLNTTLRHRHGQKEPHSAAQSAINIASTNPFSELTKLSGKGQGRRPENVADLGGRASLEAERRNGATDVPQSRVKPENLALEKERQQQRNKELKSSLNALSELARNSTRQIDHTYYMLLEKVTSLQTAIHNLTDLTSATTSLQHEFESEIKDLESNIQTQIDNFKDFSDQQNRVKELESRIKVSTESAKSLSDRLEQARRNVEEWQNEEKEFQAAASMRIKIGWACIATFALLVLAIVTIQSFVRPRSTQTASKDALEAFAWNHTWYEAARELFNTKVGTRSANAGASTSSDTSFQQIDARLRIFDEL